MSSTITAQPVCYPLDVACPQLAEAYVPIQPWGDVFAPNKALMAGTIFPCLVRPLEPLPDNRRLKP